MEKYRNNVNDGDQIYDNLKENCKFHNSWKMLNFLSVLGSYGNLLFFCINDPAKKVRNVIFALYSLFSVISKVTIKVAFS